MSRDEDIEAIVAQGRQTRQPTPRWLWIASAIVGGICAVGFAIAMLGDGDGDRAGPRPGLGATDGDGLERRPARRGGLGIGLVIGGCVGIVIGFSIGRQRTDHSSRNSP